MVKKGFTFGKNWLFFVDKYFDSETIKEAKKSLLDFANSDNYKGKTFLDIGSGSGLFSLAAYQLGAKKVFSFDFDQDSVLSTRKLRVKEGKPKNWQIVRGSILNRKFLKKIGKYDFVYAWGVLHHTGKMWPAIENTLDLVDKEGYLYLAIYNRADSWGIYPDGRFGTSAFWTKVKKNYSGSPLWARQVVDYQTIFILGITYLLKFKNPFEEARNHSERHRGMSWLADIRDWLGGYPYEYASAAEIFNFVTKRGFTLKNLKTNNGLMNNEYLFKKN